MTKLSAGNIQKDFYGKAKTNGTQLYSYNTLVASISDGKLVRHWDGWSATTQKHINAFCDVNGLPRIIKKDWIKMEVI